MMNGLEKQKYTLWIASQTESLYKIAEGLSDVRVTMSNRYIEGDTIVGVPMMFPAGYISVPDISANMVGLNIGGVVNYPVALGVMVASDPKETPPYGDLAVGESVMYSNNYQMRFHNTDIKAHINNSQLNTEINLFNGDWAAKMFQDIQNQLQSLYEKLDLVETNYATHTHVASGTPTSIPSNTISFGQLSDDITTDNAAINDGEVYLDTKSTLPGGS